MPKEAVGRVWVEISSSTAQHVPLTSRTSVDREIRKLWPSPPIPCTGGVGVDNERAAASFDSERATSRRPSSRVVLVQVVAWLQKIVRKLEPFRYTLKVYEVLFTILLWIGIGINNVGIFKYEESSSVFFPNLFYRLILFDSCILPTPH